MANALEVVEEKEPMGRKTWLSASLIVLLILTVLLPIWIPQEVSKWYVAAADNHFRKNEMEESAQMLDRAREYSESIVQSPDYLRLKGMIAAKNGDPNAAIEILNSTDSNINPASKIQASWMLSIYFYESGDFSNALQALNQGFAVIDAPSSLLLNQRAYLRALANEELDGALKDIELAMEKSPEQPELMDTKGWVLYRLARFEEAKQVLKVAHQDILNRLKDEDAFVGLPIEKVPENFGLLPSDQEEPSGSEAEKQLVKKVEAWRETVQLLERLDHHAAIYQKLQKPRIHTLAVYRFHLMKVLEALDETEEAEPLGRWLRFHGFTSESFLY